MHWPKSNYCFISLLFHFCAHYVCYSVPSLVLLLHSLSPCFPSFLPGTFQGSVMIPFPETCSDFPLPQAKSQPSLAPACRPSLRHLFYSLQPGLVPARTTFIHTASCTWIYLRQSFPFCLKTLVKCKVFPKSVLPFSSNSPIPLAQWSKRLTVIGFLCVYL